MTHASSKFASIAISSQLDRLVMDVSSKIAAGEPINLDALTAECLEHREQLEMLLPTLVAMADLGHSLEIGATNRSTHITSTIQHSLAGAENPSSIIQHPN